MPKGTWPAAVRRWQCLSVHEGMRCGRHRWHLGDHCDARSFIGWDRMGRAL